MELNSCVMHVLRDFSSERLKASEYSCLLFENTMKVPCCFIFVSFRWQTSFMFPSYYVYIFLLYKIKIGGKANSGA